MFLPQYEKENSNISLPFSCLKEFYFGFLIAYNSFFIFIKTWKTEYSSFFVFHFHEGIEKRITVLKKIKINFMIIFTSIVCTLFKSKFISHPEKFSAVQWSCGHQKSAVQKTADHMQLMYFNVYITDCYFHICFIL